MTAPGRNHARTRDTHTPKAHGWPSVGFFLITFMVTHLAFSSGCAAPPPQARTTFLTGVDLVEMTDRMAVSFAGDHAIGARTPETERWVISFDRIINRTNQIIPDREKWLYIARLRALLAQSTLAADRNILWIMPPERWAEVRAEVAPDMPPDVPEAFRLPPTHLMTAEFLALTSTSGAGRSDTYVTSWQLIDLRSGIMVWEDLWEMKRARDGLTYD